MTTAAEIDATALVAFEAGWERRASADHDFFAPITCACEHAGEPVIEIGERDH